MKLYLKKEIGKRMLLLAGAFLVITMSSNLNTVYAMENTVTLQGEADDENSIVAGAGLTKAQTKYKKVVHTGYITDRKTKKKIWQYTYTTKFAYDGNLVVAYSVSRPTFQKLIDKNNIMPKFMKKSCVSFSPTLAGSKVVVGIYKKDGTIDYEQTSYLYCNQKGRISAQD